MRFFKVTVVLIIIAVIAAFIITKTSSKQLLCSGVTDEMIKKEIQENFLAGIPNSPFELEALGSTDPAIEWGEIGRNQDVTNKTISVPFVAKGIKENLNMIGIYTCSNGSIEYSIDK